MKEHDGRQPDGRRTRRDSTHKAILAACAELMREGDERPSAEAIALRVNCVPRTVHNHFPCLGGLYLCVLSSEADLLRRFLSKIPQETLRLATQ